MKLNEEELSIIPSTPRYAKDHMEIYRHAKGFLDNFLHMDEDIDKLSFQAHNSWIQSYKLEKPDHPTFMIKYGKRVVGLIFLREAYFMGGVQIIYVMNKNFSGRGIMQRALEHILEVAFLVIGIRSRSYYQSIIISPKSIGNDKWWKKNRNHPFAMHSQNWKLNTNFKRDNFRDLDLPADSYLEDDYFENI